MRIRLILAWAISLTLFSVTLTLAAPLQLTVQPKGTNQVALTIGPAIQGGVYGVLARTNGPGGHWIVFGPFFGDTNKTLSVTCELSGGMTVETLANCKFVAGNWEYSPYYNIPPLAKELIFRTDPSSYIDPNTSLIGDGWSNIQKFQNNMDPFEWYEPPAPRSSIQFHQGTNDFRRNDAILTWQLSSSAVPDYFLIERANRTLRPRTNDFRFTRPGPNGFNGLPPTNRPPFSRPINGRPPGWQHEEQFVTGPFEIIARIPGQPGVSNYRFVDSNVDAFPQPIYRIQPHYSPPLHAHLNHVDAAEIRKTILAVSARETTNGYALTVANPIPHALYLLLVRDKNDLQWRASGYFASGATRSPVYLHVDKKGMMSDGQSPIAMPEVKFLPDVVDPEFTAGWGEDSDGDGLPDIYEVLVTQTDPDNADTGNTGTLDGYKDMALDGWSNLEKFRRRSNPQKTAQPPSTVELIKPTGVEIMKAISQQSDLRFELKIEARTNDASNYQPIENLPKTFYSAMNYRQPDERRNFDLRVSWHIPQEKPYVPNDPTYSEFPTPEQTIESLEGKANMRLFETFSNGLVNQPSFSRNAMSNNMVAIEHAYRQGEIDKGVAMAEMMTLANNQSQDFYGKVIDQYGQPVTGADVTLGINLAIGRGGSQKTQTDAAGLFQFTGIKGQSLNITPEKKGFQIEGHGLGLKGLNGPETSPDNRTIYTMWKLKGPEPMMHKEVNSRKIQPDGRVFTIDFLKNEITEGTNVAGDVVFQIKRPPEIKPREKYDWSFVMTAIDGGFIEVTNDDYLNEAPKSGYQPQYEMNRYATNVMNYSTWQLYRTDRTFFLKSRGGQVYGHFQIKDLDPDYRGMAALRIESFINPSGSRNLEFDPAKQIQ
jgi:hypothetical protein